MSEHDRAISVHDVDVFVAIDVPDPGTFCAFSHKRIDHLFPLRAKSCDGARVCKVASRPCGQTFRSWGTLLILRDQRIEILLLVVVEVLLNARLERPVRPMFDLRRFACRWS